MEHLDYIYFYSIVKSVLINILRGGGQVEPCDVKFILVYYCLNNNKCLKIQFQNKQTKLFLTNN